MPGPGGVTLDRKARCAFGGYGGTRRKKNAPLKEFAGGPAPSTGGLPDCLANERSKVAPRNRWNGPLENVEADLLRRVGAGAFARQFVRRLCARAAGGGTHVCKMCARIAQRLADDFAAQHRTLRPAISAAAQGGGGAPGTPARRRLAPAFDGLAAASGSGGLTVGQVLVELLDDRDAARLSQCSRSWLRSVRSFHSQEAKLRASVRGLAAKVRAYQKVVSQLSSRDLAGKELMIDGLRHQLRLIEQKQQAMISQEGEVIALGKALRREREDFEELTFCYEELEKLYEQARAGQSDVKDDLSGTVVALCSDLPGGGYGLSLKCRDRMTDLYCLHNVAGHKCLPALVDMLEGLGAEVIGGGFGDPSGIVSSCLSEAAEMEHLDLAYRLLKHIDPLFTAKETPETFCNAATPVLARPTADGPVHTPNHPAGSYMAEVWARVVAWLEAGSKEGGLSTITIRDGETVDLEAYIADKAAPEQRADAAPRIRRAARTGGVRQVLQEPGCAMAWLGQDGTSTFTDKSMITTNVGWTPQPSTQAAFDLAVERPAQPARAAQAGGRRRRSSVPRRNTALQETLVSTGIVRRQREANFLMLKEQLFGKGASGEVKLLHQALEELMDRAMLFGASEEGMFYIYDCVTFNLDNCSANKVRFNPGFPLRFLTVSLPFTAFPYCFTALYCPSLSFHCLSLLFHWLTHLPCSRSSQPVDSNSWGLSHSNVCFASTGRAHWALCAAGGGSQAVLLVAVRVHWPRDGMGALPTLSQL